jgi:MATE family multidrug resistance protein
LISQLAQVGMGVTDTVMAGRYAAIDLAGVALGTSVWVPIYVAFAGLLIANTSLVAHAIGADDSQRARRTAQQAVWMALLLCPLPLLMLYHADILLAALGNTGAAQAIADRYLDTLALAVPALAWYLCMRGVAESHGFTRPVMLTSLAALALNVPFNAAFMYGVGSIAAQGGAGCASATALLLVLQAVVLTIVVHRHPRFKRLQLFRQWSAPKLASLRRLLALGGPIALTSFAETALFSATTLLLAPLGAIVVAANHIAMNISVLFFMVPFSISIATTVRVGQHLGAGHAQQARFAALQALKLSLAAPVLAFLVLVFGGETITAWYTGDQELRRIASGLLLWAALFQFSDALQACALGALRGYRDTRTPFWLTLTAYWGIAVPVGYTLTYGGAGVVARGVSGMWIGLIVGLTLAAAALLWRLNHVSATRIASGNDPVAPL